MLFEMKRNIVRKICATYYISIEIFACECDYDIFEIEGEGLTKIMNM